MSADEQQNEATAVVVASDAAETEAIVDQERSEKILKAKELYSQGSRNFLVKSYAESADELSQVCALYEELYGELSDELGMPYLLYAKSLIALALDENKVIDVPDEEDDDDDDEEDAVDNEEEDIDADAVADVEVKAAVGENGEAAIMPTNGTAKKSDAIKEVDSSNAKSATADEADSTENSAGEKSTEDENKTKIDTEKTDEAMVTSTENSSTTEVPEKNGTSTNGNCMAKVAVDGEKPSTSNGDAAAADDDEDFNEAASSLQLAWEILELAAKIFSRQGLSGLPNLAEVQTELANIEFENNILDAAREDYEKALKIYGELTSNYRRAMAEIHYKIGLTYLMQSLNKEGAESLKQACNLIEEEISEMKAKENVTEKDKNNIQDMEETKQEIMAKIVEIEEMQAQQIADVRAALDKVINPVAVENTDGAGPSSSSSNKTAEASSSSSSSSAAITSSSKPTDISHLIKRKKPEEPHSEAEAAAPSPAKRPAV